jgi:hypothetical protein
VSNQANFAFLVLGKIQFENTHQELFLSVDRLQLETAIFHRNLSDDSGELIRDKIVQRYGTGAIHFGQKNRRARTIFRDKEGQQFLDEYSAYGTELFVN